MKAKDSELPDSEPGRFLEANHDLLVARVRGLRDVETVREYLEYECRNANRDGVKEMLKAKMRQVRD